jgi:uncharacterized protein YdhG (YjbR/CyaY superfamily)
MSVSFKKKPETVAKYIAQAPKWAQPVLKELRKAIKAAAPKATESISYHMPYYAQNGRLAYVAANKKHVGFHWISVEDKKTFAKELARQKVVGSTLHLPQGEKVPITLIKKIITSRVKNNEARKKK